MKYEENVNENAKLLKSKNKDNYSPRIEEYPLLNSKFLTFLKIVNIATLAYIIISTFFYFLVHFYGKRIIKSKSLRLEYDSLLFHNLFINFFFIFATILGFLTIKNRSLYYFFVYFFTLTIYSIAFVISYISDFFSDYLVNKKLIWFSYVMVFISACLIFYCVFHFIQVIENSKRAINHMPASGIIHEISLRTDMLKFSFNNFMINTRLAKILPSLMFRKNSYYFMTLNNKQIHSDGLEVDSTLYKTNGSSTE